MALLPSAFPSNVTGWPICSGTVDYFAPLGWPVCSGTPADLLWNMQAVFEMPVIAFNHNLIKIGKRQYRNPIVLAKEWRKALDNGEYASPAALARELKVSRARVTQILNLLKLPKIIIEKVSAIGDPLPKPIVTERSLRQLLKNVPA